MDLSRYIERYKFLTPRQREIAEFLTEGWSYKQAIKRFDIADSTMRTHVVNIYNCLGIERVDKGQDWHTNPRVLLANIVSAVKNKAHEEQKCS